MMSVKVDPLPSSLSTVRSPPSRRARLRLMESPSPVPPYWRVVLVSACWNSLKDARQGFVADADAGVGDGDAQGYRHPAWPPE